MALAEPCATPCARTPRSVSTGPRSGNPCPGFQEQILYPRTPAAASRTRALRYVPERRPRRRPWRAPPPRRAGPAGRPGSRSPRRVEVGLPHPALRPDTPDDVHALGVLRYGEAGVVDGGRADHDTGALGRRRPATLLLDQRGDREEQLVETLVGDRAHLVHGKTARLKVGPHD